MSTTRKQEIDLCNQQINSLRAKIAEKCQIDPQILKKEASDTPPKSWMISQQKTLKGHFGKVYALDWGKDTDLVSASQDGKLMVWNALTTNKKMALPLRSVWVMTCAFAPSGELVACGGLDNLCSVYRIDQDTVGWENKPPYRELQRHEGYLSCCKFVDDSTIITSSGDSRVIYWDIETKQPINIFYEHTCDVMNVSVNRNIDPNLCVSGACDGKAKLWDFRTNTCVGNFAGHQSDINSVDWFPDFRGFASGSDDATARFFDIRSHKCVNVYTSSEVRAGITSVCFAKSGSRLYCGYDDIPKFCLSYHTTSGTVAQALDHVDRVSCLSISRCGQALATGCWDNHIRIWA